MMTNITLADAGIARRTVSRAARCLAPALATLLFAGCASQSPPRPEPIPLASGADVCERDPAVCKESCARCPEDTSCFDNAGECTAGGIHFDDRNDGGADIWTPGCHHEYTDAACTQNQAMFVGDVCANQVDLVEWTLSTCHGPTGDRATYDCNKECQRAGLGNGRCVTLPGACPAGRDSARCECDTPPPTQ